MKKIPEGAILSISGTKLTKEESEFFSKNKSFRFCSI